MGNDKGKRVAIKSVISIQLSQWAIGAYSWRKVLEHGVTHPTRGVREQGYLFTRYQGHWLKPSPGVYFLSTSGFRMLAYMCMHTHTTHNLKFWQNFKNKLSLRHRHSGYESWISNWTPGRLQGAGWSTSSIISLHPHLREGLCTHFIDRKQLQREVTLVEVAL